MAAVFLLAWALGLSGDAFASGDSLAFLFGGGGKKEKGVLGKKERALARERLAGLQGEARLILFAEERGCKRCDEAERLLEEIASFSDGVAVEVLSLSGDAGRAGELGIDKAPGIALFGAADTGIRYYGLPLGYEFEAFLGAIVQAAAGRAELAPATLAGLGELRNPVTITVFVAEA